MRRRPGAALVRPLTPLRNCRSPCRKISGLNYRRAEDGERTARIGGTRKGGAARDRITVEATAKACKRYNTCTVQFQAVRSLAIPPRPRTHQGGGALRFARIICRGPIFHFKRRPLLRQCCDARGFTPPPIEILARRKVAPAFEPQKASGRGTPASECKPMDALGPTALSRCARFQHQGCGDYSLSNVV